MYNKILSFVVNEDSKLFLRRNNPVDPAHGGDIWFVISGRIEKDDTDRNQTVIREIKEETNLDVKETMYLNWIFKYTFNNIDCIEYVYISFVQNGEVQLNEESIDYKWCNIDEFLNQVKWFGNKEILQKVLKEAINKKTYFKDEIIENS